MAPNETSTTKQDGGAPVKEKKRPKKKKSGGGSGKTNKKGSAKKKPTPKPDDGLKGPDLERSNWLTKLAGAPAKKEQFEKDAAKKELLLDQMRRSLDDLGKDGLRQSLTFKIKEKRRIGPDKELVSQGEGVSDDDLIETMDVEKYKSMDPKEYARVQTEYAKLVQLQNQLKAATTTVERDGKTYQVPMFSDEEIGTEFWEPLHREGVVPENLIIDKYSKVQEMLNASSALYMQRLEKDRKTATDQVTSKDFVSGLSQIGQSLAKTFAGPHADLAVTAIQLAELTTNTAIDVGKALQQKDLSAAGGTILDNIGKLIGNAVTIAAGKDLGDLVGNAVGGGAMAVKFAKRLAQHWPPSVDDVGEAAGFLAEAFNQAGQAGASSGTSAGERLAEIAPMAATLFAQVAKAPKVVKALQERKIGDVIMLLSTAASAVIDASFKELKDLKGVDMTALNKQIDEGIDLAARGLKTGADVIMALKKGDFNDAADAFLDNIGSLVSGALAPVNPKLASEVGGAVSSGASLGKFANALSKGADDPKNIEEALTALAGAFSEAGKVGAAAGGKGGADFQKIGDWAAKTFLGLVTARIPDLKKAIEDGDFNKVVTILTAAGKTVVDNSFGLAQGFTEKDLSEIQKKVDEGMDLSAIGLKTGVAVFVAIKKGDLHALADDVLGNIGDFVQGALSLSNLDKGVAAEVGAAVKGAAAAGKFANAMAKGPLDDGNQTDALAALAGVFTEAGVLAAAKGGQGGADFQKIGDWAAGAFQSMAAAKLPQIRAALKKQDLKTVVAILSAAGKGVADASFKGVKDTAGLDLSAVQQVVDDMKLDDPALQPEPVVFEGEKGAGVEAAVDKAVAELAKAFGGAMEKVHPDLKAAATNAFTSSAGAGAVSALFKKANFLRGVTALGRGYEAAFALCNPDPENAELKKIGPAMARAFVKGADAAAIKKAVEGDEYDKAIAALKAGGDKAAAVLNQAKGTAQGEDDVSAGAAAFKQAMASAGNRDKLKQQVDDAQAEQIRAEVQSSESAFEKELEEARKSDQDRYRDLVVGAGGQASAEARSIEKLIFSVQKKKMVLTLCSKLSSGGVQVASAFFGPLAIAGTAIKFVMSVMEAANQAMELNKWLATAKRAENAVSVYGSAVANFIKNRDEQIAHATIKAALQFVQLAGQVTSMSGLAAPIGEAINKIGMAAESAEDLIYKAYKKADLERAWRVTRAAMQNPGNRKLGKKAQRLNATLSKYALAWGALVKHDPIAESAMKSCGLNEVSLADKNADAHKVVAYLEVYYDQDTKVVKATALLAEWRPKKLVLTAKCWASAQRLGQELAAPKLAPGALTGLLGALTRVEKHTQACQKAKEICKNAAEAKKLKGMEYEDLAKTADELRRMRDVRDDCLADLKVVEAELTSYTPLDVDGRPHREMAEVIKEFQDLVDVRVVSVENLKTTVDAALEKVEKRLTEKEEELRTEQELADLEDQEGEEGEL